jgi:hypothetical protein
MESKFRKKQSVSKCKFDSDGMKRLSLAELASLIGKEFLGLWDVREMSWVE